MKAAVVFLVVFVAHCSANGLFEDQLEDLLSQDGGFCSDKRDGNYADSKNCNRYITCTNGLTIRNRPCPNGLAFNPAVDQCDYRSNVPGCGSSGGRGFCKNKPNGDYADPKSCHRFITCSNRLTYRTKCPEHTNFNARLKRCDNIACTESDEGFFSTENDGGFCSGKDNGDYPDPDTCEGFISCSNGHTYKMPCPAGLRFNPKTKKCDYAKNVKCGPTRPPRTTARPTTKPPFTKSPFCINKKNGDYPDANNCNGFITCSNGYIYYRDCPSNLRYDPKKKRCEWPDTVDCKTRPTGSPPKPRPTTKATKAPSNPFCNGKPDGDYADPDNCNGFITCSNSITYKMNCPSNLKYDPTKARCEWPGDVDCGSRPTQFPYTTKKPTLATTAASGNSKFCQINGNGRFRDPHNCLGYIICRSGYIFFRNCRTGLRFNGQTKRCDLPRNVKCAGAGGGTFCVGKKDGDYVDDVNCNGFIKCSNELTYYFDCPSNLRFNIKKDWCDWPKNVACPYMP